MRAGLYARVSTEEQATEGYSLDAQLEAMRRYTAAQGWTVAHEYEDPGFSGSDGDRPAFCQMMADAEAHRLDVVIVHKLDRFYRNLEWQLKALRSLEGWGVSFVSVVEAIDFSTPWGRLAQQQLGAFNEFYLSNLRQEVRKGKRGRAKAGGSNASTPPYGYRREWPVPDLPGNDVIDPDTAQAVLLAFESYSTGKYSDAEVAALLNQAGHLPSGRAESGRWAREAVRYMLTNPFYAGQVPYGDETHPGRHAALIDEGLWREVQAVRLRRRRSRSGRRRPERVYLLAGLARCDRCHLPLVAEAHPGKVTEYLYLRDPANRRGFDCPSGGRSVRVKLLDDQVGRLVQAIILPADWRARVVELVGCQDQRESIGRERTRLAEKLRRLRRAYTDVEMDEATYRLERADTQARLDALVIPEESAVMAAGSFLETLAVAWTEATPPERREMLHVLLEAVLVDVADRRIVCVQPRGSFASLFRQIPSLREDDGCFYLAERSP